MNENENTENLLPDELSYLKDLKNKAEKSAMESKIHELEYKNAIQSIYLKYKLNVDATIDITSGKITNSIKKEQELA